VDVTAGGKLFGLFGGAGGNFEYHEASDTPGSPSVTQGSQENPTLAETVTAAIDVLGDDPDGFFVMFEQGDIDWSNHANDFENMIGGVWDLDQAVRAAEAAVDDGDGGMDWSNTLMIVTSDHSNSYMRNETVLGAGGDPRGENLPFILGERDLRVGWRHHEVGIGTRDPGDQFAVIGVAGDDRPAATFEFAEGGRAEIQPEASFPTFLIRAVALEAPVGKDGADVAVKVGAGRPCR